MKTSVYRVSLVREKTVEYPIHQIGNSAIAASAVRQIIKRCGQADREQMVVLLMSSKNTIIGANIAHTGTINGCGVHPREIFKPAVAGNTAAIILAHNHPSGDIRPSSEDYRITDRMVEAGEILGIEVLDHVIVDMESTDYYSLRETGHISGRKKHDL